MKEIASESQPSRHVPSSSKLSTVTKLGPVDSPGKPHDRFGGWHYPKWQFDADGRVLREVATIVRLFKSRDKLYLMGQFLYPQDGHQLLIEPIRSGRGDEAVALARDSVR